MSAIYNHETNSYEFTASINLEVTARELAKDWKNANKFERDDIIDKLRLDHAGLTALLLTQFGPNCDGVLSSSDVNMIANMLIDDRAEMCIGE